MIKNFCPHNRHHSPHQQKPWRLKHAWPCHKACIQFDEKFALHRILFLLRIMLLQKFQNLTKIFEKKTVTRQNFINLCDFFTSCPHTTSCGGSHIEPQDIVVGKGFFKDSFNTLKLFKKTIFISFPPTPKPFSKKNFLIEFARIKTLQIFLLNFFDQENFSESLFM